MAIEEAAFTIIMKSGAFEFREYAPYIVAETVVEASLEEAGNKAFRRLFRYISGDNISRDKIAMTAPVNQESAGEKIAMTAPVNQEQHATGTWRISFTMPASCTMDSVPIPNDPRVTLRQVPARRMAAVRYSGRWSEKSFLNHKERLVAWIGKNGFRITGEAVWARYNPPFTLWFLRRNEILIPVQTGEEQ